MDDVDKAVVCALALRFRKRKRKRELWVHPIFSSRLLKGQFYKLFSELRKYPEKFFQYSRMTVASFDELLSLMRPLITYQDTTMRLSVPAEERLMVTLR